MGLTDPISVYVMPTGPTMWDREDRVQGNIDLPLADDVDPDTLVPAHWPPASIKVIHCGPSEAARQTAAALAKPSRAKVKILDDLEEMNLGLWQGLRREDIRERYYKVAVQWRTDPAAVSIPSGETVDQTFARLSIVLSRLIEKSGSSAVVLVVRPIIRSMIASLLTPDADLTTWKEPGRDESFPIRYDLDKAAWLDAHAARRMKRSVV